MSQKQDTLCVDNTNKSADTQQVLRAECSLKEIRQVTNVHGSVAGATVNAYLKRSA
jgi:hypothetical protein